MSPRTDNIDLVPILTALQGVCRDIQAGLEFTVKAVTYDDPKREILVRLADELNAIKQVRMSLSTVTGVMTKNADVVASERERCAQIAESYSNAKPGDICEVMAGDFQAGIAEAIRRTPALSSNARGTSTSEGA